MENPHRQIELIDKLLSENYHDSKEKAMDTYERMRYRKFKDRLLTVKKLYNEKVNGINKRIL